MRLKKTLFAVVTMMATASMVLPVASADQGKAAKKRPAVSAERAQPLKAGTYRGAGDTRDFDAPDYKAFSIDTSSLGMGLKPGDLTPALLDRLNIRPADAPNVPFEAAMKARTEARAAAKAGKAGKGGVSAEQVLPSSTLSDDQTFSTTGMVGMSGTQDTFDGLFLLGDYDGNNKIERDFDNITGPISAPRTAIDRHEAIYQGGLAGDEVYTDVALSGESVANGFGRNVYYSGTNAGRFYADVDVAADGNVAADAATVATLEAFIVANSSFQLTNLPVGASAAISGYPASTVGPFSPSASITGIYVEQDAEYVETAFPGNAVTGEPAAPAVQDVTSDEVVYVSVFDPQMGVPRQSASVLIQLRDSADADQVPDIFNFRYLAVSLANISAAGVAGDSMGDIYWHITDATTGYIVKFRDAALHDRLPDTAGYPELGAGASLGIFNPFGGLDAANTANAVEMTIDRYDRVYLQVAAGLGRQVNGTVATGLPSHIATYVDRCPTLFGITDFNTGFLPRPDGVADVPATFTGGATQGAFGIYASQAPLPSGITVNPGGASPAGGGGEGGQFLIIDELRNDYSGYAGLATDYDDNIYVAVGAAPADASGNQSPFFGQVLRIPDTNCDGIGDAADFNGNGTFGEGTDYLWMDNPINPATRTPEGVDGIDFGTLRSLRRMTGPSTTTTNFTLMPRDDSADSYVFDEFDSAPVYQGTGLTGANNSANLVAGGVCDRLQFGTNITGTVVVEDLGAAAGFGEPRSNNGGVLPTTWGGPAPVGFAVGQAGHPQTDGAGGRGFEFLFGNIARTGFFLNSNGNITFGVGDPFASGTGIIGVPNFLSFAPRIAPAYTDLNPAVVRVAPPVGVLGNAPQLNRSFSIIRLGFSSVDAFIIQWIDVPEFGFEFDFILGGGGLAYFQQINSFDITLFDDQDGWDDVIAEFTGGGDFSNQNNVVNTDADGLHPSMWYRYPNLIGLTSVPYPGPSALGGAPGSVPPAGDANPAVTFGPLFCMPAAVDYDDTTPDGRANTLGHLIDRNRDADITDEGITEAGPPSGSGLGQEGVGRTKPEQGPIQFRYHVMELIGSEDNPVVVGWSLPDATLNNGSIPPGLCEIDLSSAAPPATAPFMPLQIGMGTEGSQYEVFNEGLFGFTDPVTGLPTPSFIDFDLRDLDAACLDRTTTPNGDPLFADLPFEGCLNFKGSNMPLGLFCQRLATSSTNTDPFVGPVTISVNGFCFPMPTTGANAICPQFCSTTAPLCRNGKAVTYTAMVFVDEDNSGFVFPGVRNDGVPIGGFEFMTTVPVTAVNETLLQATLNFANNFTFCGGGTTFVKIEASFTPRVPDQLYQEFTGTFTAGGAPITAPVRLRCMSTSTTLIARRNPIVTAIAPDEKDCNDESEAVDIQEVIVTGVCFAPGIASGFIAINRDGTGQQFPLENIIMVSANSFSASIRVNPIPKGVPFYVFVRRTGGGDNIGTPAQGKGYPNVFGFDVDFLCTQTTAPPVPPVITSCNVVRQTGGKYILQVNGTGFVPGANNTGSVVLLGAQVCKKNKFPAQFIGSDGRSTRINCSGGIKNSDFPITISVRNPNGTTSGTAICRLP